MVGIWLSSFPGSFPAVVTLSGGTDREVGEIGRDGDAYLSKMSLPVRICIVSGNEKGWGGRAWLENFGDRDITACRYRDIRDDRGTCQFVFESPSGFRRGNRCRDDSR